MSRHCSNYSTSAQTNLPLRPASEWLAASSGDTRRLESGVAELDMVLEGGLAFGSVSEWGMPEGCGGREVILPFLARATSCQNSFGGSSSGGSFWCLWIRSQDDTLVYPPAWAARGVDLTKMRFVQVARSVADLRPLFLSPFFRVIVIDSPREFGDDDAAFLVQQARRLGFVVLVLRPFFLTARRGHVWARPRLNCWGETEDGRFGVHVIRGLRPRRLVFSLPTPSIALH